MTCGLERSRELQRLGLCSKGRVRIPGVNELSELFRAPY